MCAGCGIYTCCIVVEKLVLKVCFFKLSIEKKNNIQYTSLNFLILLEQSLSGLDDTVNEYETKIETIDAETRDMVRSQVKYNI